METRIALFQQKEIRRTFHNEEWWFSVIDVVVVLTDSSRPRKYWSDLKAKLLENEGFSELSDKIGQLKFQATDGKMYSSDAANTETLLRLIQSIPSPKAEPFKRWLAQVGYERIQEIENPELATERTRALYKAKGYSDGWIEKRLRGIAIRDELTNEWQKRGAKEQTDYGILTAEISKATFGLTPAEYKQHKGLKRENLRDHMSGVELVFSMLGEAATTEIHRAEDSQGAPKLREDAKAGGNIAGDARRQLEKRIKRSVVSRENYLTQTETRKRVEGKNS